MGRYVFKLPDVGEGTAEAELVAWHVKVGERVEEDQLLAEVMTDKATVELTSPVTGFVVALYGEPGVQAPVGGPLVAFEVEGAGNASATEGDAVAEASAESDVIVPFATASAVEPEAAEAVVEPEAVQAEVAAEPAAQASIGGTHVFRLPDVGEGTAEAELVAWHVAVGDAVEEDQLLAEVMTDKATVELTSPVAGVVAILHGQPGTQSPVGGPLVTFSVEGAGNVTSPFPLEGGRAGDGGEAPAPEAAPPPPSPAPEKTEVAISSLVRASTPTQPSPLKGEGSKTVARTPQTPGVRPLASPAVRNRARDMGINLAFVPGSGPAGRIGHEDLDAFIAHGATPPSVSGSSSPTMFAKAEGTTEVRIIGLRRKIAEKMAESVRRIPHITYVEEIDVTALEELRAHLNATKQKDQPKLNLLPFIARAIVVALKDQPQINATYDDEAGVLTQHAAVHLGIAAQTPNGLMVPVVRHAEALDAWAASLEIARVSGAAKDGSAKRDELSGSTITITSLGTLGGVVHTPIINHPEVAIVGPNKIAERVVVRDGQMVVRKMMNLSSSFDHRIVDGHDAAVFVQRIKGLLEQPATLWMG
jgi:2-oxoisovalerate dehydrogenase E2 component (dihydrolipoyl transacylase)